MVFICIQVDASRNAEMWTRQN